MDPSAPGISGLCAYVPPYEVSLEAFCAWTRTSWEKTRAVVGERFRVAGIEEDVYTMAANAVLSLIERYDIDPLSVGYLALGTESSSDNAVGAVIVRGLVDEALAARGLPRLARDCEVPEIKQACLAGLYGVKAALRYLACDGADRKAIVVAADIAEYARGSSGEPTQGAGAVAMLLEAKPRLLTLDLQGAGRSSAFRRLDFRKPFARFAGQAVRESGRLSDFPVFNGRFSTACYLDATLAALGPLLARREEGGAAFLRSLEAAFLHRPYRKMPVTAWATGYLMALANGNADDVGELAGYCEAAGVSLDAVRAELRHPLAERAFAPDFDVGLERPYPLAAELLGPFRDTPAYAAHVEQKLALGAGTMLSLGNLYSAALPAWLAAGLEQAALEERVLDGRSVLLVGYGSGDAAEAIAAHVVPGYREAAARISLSAALEGAVALTEPQYTALHEGRAAPGLVPARRGVFLEGVGAERQGPTADFGIARYRVA